MGALVAVTLVVGCKGAKAKKAIFAALDNHRIEYGKCEIMSEAKGDIDGKPAWMMANVCKARHRKDVMTEAGDAADAKSFQTHFDDWKKENGAKAVADARSEPDKPSAASTGPFKGGGDDCPQGAACLNRCKAECEGKHGAMMDSASIGPCAKAGGKPEECVKKAMNQETRRCFFTCRGLPTPTD